MLLRVVTPHMPPSTPDPSLAVAGLHKRVTGDDRDKVLAKFENGKTQVLVCSDVGARGVDYTV